MLDEFIIYMEKYLNKVYKDAENLAKLMEDFEGDYDSDEYRDLEIDDMNNTGELYATSHLLSVAHDMMSQTNKGE